MFSSPAQRTVASSPLHSASVHITGFADLVNPNPWKFDLPKRREENDDPSQGYLSPKKLVELTGESNLQKVDYLEFSINTLENSLGNFGIKDEAIPILYLDCILSYTPHTFIHK